MMDIHDREEFTQQVRTLQVIVIALAMGVAAFGVVLVLFVQPEPKEEGIILQAYMAAGAALLATLLGLIVPGFVTRGQPPTINLFQTNLIVKIALFEGAAFFNLVAYLLEGQLFSLVVAAALLVLILIQLPTVGSVHDWLHRRRRDQEQRDAFGSQ